MRFLSRGVVRGGVVGGVGGCVGNVVVVGTGGSAVRREK